MLTIEWWAKNRGGIFLSIFCAVALYAASAYITATVSREMKNYVPLPIWAQWAQERSEWRGGVDVQIKSLQAEQQRLRGEIQQQLATLDKKQDVQGARTDAKLDAQTMILNELKMEIGRHINNKQ